MPDHLGADMRKTNEAKDEEDDKPIVALDQGDIEILQTYVIDFYTKLFKFYICFSFSRELVFTPGRLRSVKKKLMVW